MHHEEIPYKGANHHANRKDSRKCSLDIDPMTSLEVWNDKVQRGDIKVIVLLESEPH